MEKIEAEADRLAVLIGGIEHVAERACEKAAICYGLVGGLKLPAQAWPFASELFEGGSEETALLRCAAFATLENRVWRAAGGGDQEMASKLIAMAMEAMESA